MKNRMKLIGIVALLTAFLSAGCGNASSVDNETDVFVPVTNITGVIKFVTVGKVSLSGTVVPNNATNKNIRWYVVDGEDTEATISGNILTTKAEGTVVVMAAIFDGIAEGVRYTKNFTIFVDPFVPVKKINPRFSGQKVNDYQYQYKVGEIYLDGTVDPNNASYTDIVWTVKDAGTTLGRIKYGDDVLTTRAEGTVLITATIINGKADGIDYTEDFSIDIYDDIP
jgi:uncharacterized protein YjdB